MERKLLVHFMTIDNAPAHSVLSIRLAPCKLFLLSKLKSMLKEHCIDSIDDKNKFVKGIAGHFKRSFAGIREESTLKGTRTNNLVDMDNL